MPINSLLDDGVLIINNVINFGIIINSCVIIWRRVCCIEPVGMPNDIIFCRLGDMMVRDHFWVRYAANIECVVSEMMRPSNMCFTVQYRNNTPGVSGQCVRVKRQYVVLGYRLDFP
jgi:hypothetical protein